MGAESTSGGGGETTTEVLLNVYDLTPVNNYSYWFGFGIFHSGIEVEGKEYGFGAHDYAVSGVFEVEPKTCPGFIYRCSLSLGRVQLPCHDLRAFIEGVASEYHGDTYNLISKNCNHFTHDLSTRLTGKGIPAWVNRLARLGALCSCLLPESLQANTVKQSPEYQDGSEEDESDSLSSGLAHDSAEIDDDQEKRLLSPLARSGDFAFVKERHR